jgi:hypothetical protein
LKQHYRETTPKAKITINSRRIQAMVRMLPNAMAWERDRGRDAGVVRVCCCSEKLLGSPSMYTRRELGVGSVHVMEPEKKMKID